MASFDGERGEGVPVQFDVYEPNGWVVSELFYRTKVTFLSLLISDRYEYSEKDYNQLHIGPHH